MKPKNNRKSLKNRSRKLSFSGDNFNQSNINENEESTFDKNDILKRKWRVFRVSPLYSFDINKLSSYAKKLCELYTLSKRADSTLLYDCEFVLNAKLKFKKDVFEALQVRIKTQYKIIYNAFFISTNHKVEIDKGFASFPILVVETNSLHVPEVHSILQKIFDCDIQKTSFSFYSLITFFVKLVESPPEKIDSTHEFELVYKIPGCENKDALKVTLFLQQTIIVLAVTVDNLKEKGISNMKLIIEFYRRILQHIYRIYNINLNSAQLHKVLFSYASIESDGLIKLNTEDAVATVFSVLPFFINVKLPESD